MIKFEDKIEDLRKLIQKRHHRWSKLLPPGIEFEDVEQIVLTHLFNKWALYDQTKPLDNWANRVISNQITNISRHNYIAYARPCFGCPHNMSCGSLIQNHEEGLCSFTKSGIQDSECEEYAKWESGKKHAFNVKIPVSYEHYGREIESIAHEDCDLESGMKHVKEKMRAKLNDKHYKIFLMLYFEDRNDDEISKFAGYKTTENNRRPGYAQIASLRKKFKAMVKEIVAEIH